jgi:hypothetical protein
MPSNVASQSQAATEFITNHRQTLLNCIRGSFASSFDAAAQSQLIAFSAVLPSSTELREAVECMAAKRT